MSFDQFFELATNDRNKENKPFWTVDLEDNEEVLKWCNDSLSTLKEQSKDRAYNMHRNLAAYRGVQYRSQSTRSSSQSERESRDDTKRSKNPRIVLNHLLDMVEQHVSKTTKYRPAIASVPGSEDIADTNTAKIADDLVENFWTKNNFDTVMQKHTRIKRICGESYVFITWDPKKGYYNRDWVQEVFERNGIKEDAGKLSRGQINRHLRKIKDWPKIELKDKAGNPVTDASGSPLIIDAPVRNGEICYKLAMPWRVYLQRRDDEVDSDWVFWTELEHVDDLKAEHPEAAGKLDKVKSTESFDSSSLKMEKTRDQIETVHFWHRTTDNLDRGRYIKFTADAVLVNEDNKYEGPYGRILPLDRLTDLDPPGSVDGDSLTTHGIPAQHLYNITMSMEARNRFLYAHPKWFVPQGSVKVESLANSTSIVQYKGGQPPILSQPALSGTDNMRDTSKEDLQQIMGVFGVSRGAPPPGIKAGVALQFLDEQENERENLAIAKHNMSIRNIAKQTMSIMGAKYGEDEHRLEEILGKSRAAEIESFQFADLSSIDDVDLQTQGALPLQKSARVQTLMDLSERFPTEVDGRQVLDMIGLGQADKYVSLSTVAVRAAELENEQILRTGKIGEAEQYEDHLMHYYIHLTMVNDPSMKKHMEPGRQEKMIAHLMTHEMFMMEIIKRNPVYMQMVMQRFPNFPSFMPEDMMQAMPPMPLPGAEQAMPQQEQPFPEVPQEMQQGAGLGAPIGEPMPSGLTVAPATAF